MTSETLSSRKNRHLQYFKIGLHDIGDTGLHGVSLNYSSLQFIFPEDVELRTSFLGAELGAPFFLASVTGGTPEGKDFNRCAAECAIRLRLPMVTGSLRMLLEHPEVFSTFDVNRDGEIPLFFGDLGVASAVRAGAARVRELCDSLRMDGIFLYFNHAQEIAQPAAEHERVDPEAVQRFIEEFHAPVCIKETGMGFSSEDLKRLGSWPIAAIDTGGCGGANFLAVEANREGFPFSSGETETLIRAVGHPTARVIHGARKLGIPVIAGGGIRSGLDMARALAIGASFASAASPLVHAWHTDSARGIEDWVRTRLEQLRMVMALCGTVTIKDFQTAHAHLIIMDN